jgi:hypothetical protein
MIMESLHEKEIANYSLDATKWDKDSFYATKWDKARKKFKQFQKRVYLNDPIHVERLKKIVYDEISSFNFPTGKRVSPEYAYQKTIYELEKNWKKFFSNNPDSIPDVSFTFDEFKKKLINVINNKVYNDRK